MPIGLELPSVQRGDRECFLVRVDRTGEKAMGYQPSDTTYTDRYRKMVDSSVDALLSSRSCRQDSDTNRTAEKRSGYSREQLLSMTALDLTPERLHGQIRAELKEAIEGGRLFESIERRKDGSEFPVEIGVEAHKIAGELLILLIGQGHLVAREFKCNEDE